MVSSVIFQRPQWLFLFLFEDYIRRSNRDIARVFGDDIQKFDAQ